MMVIAIPSAMRFRIRRVKVSKKLVGPDKNSLIIEKKFF